MAKAGGFKQGSNRFGGIPSSRTPTHPGTSSSKGPALPTGAYGAVGPRTQPRAGMPIGGGSGAMGGPRGVPSGMPAGTPTGSAAGGRENALGNPGGGAGTMPPSIYSKATVANQRNGVQNVHSAVIRGPAKGYGPRG
ncbi:MAG TPA: hypothetical protein VGI78_02270 [Acetobacteraceae bacterium]